jgi:hypothetical protein
VIFGAAEAGLAAPTSNSAVLLPPLLAHEGGDGAAVLVVVGDVLCALDDVRAAATWPPPPADLNTLFAAGDFSDILVAAQDADLAVIDANAGLLPLVRHQERLRHTLPLQRAQFALWLERGLCTGETRAAGHIRWGKAIHGLAARLGEVTATWSGKDTRTSDRHHGDRDRGAGTGLCRRRRRRARARVPCQQPQGCSWRHDARVRRFAGAFGLPPSLMQMGGS